MPAETLTPWKLALVSNNAAAPPTMPSPPEIAIAMLQPLKLSMGPRTTVI